MYYRCSENKGADQLHGYREADLRLRFRICKKPVFPRCGSIYVEANVIKMCDTFLNVFFFRKFFIDAAIATYQTIKWHSLDKCRLNNSLASEHQPKTLLFYSKQQICRSASISR